MVTGWASAVRSGGISVEAPDRGARAPKAPVGLQEDCGPGFAEPGRIPRKSHRRGWGWGLLQALEGSATAESKKGMFLESLEPRKTCLGSLRPRPAHLGGSFWKPGREVHRGLWRAPAHPGHAPHLCLEGASSLGRGPLCSQPCPRGECVQAPLQRWSPWPGPLLRWGPRSRGDSLPHLHSLGRHWGRGQPRPVSEVLAVAPKSASRISWSDSGSPPPCHPDSLATDPPAPRRTSAGEPHVLLVVTVVLSPRPSGAVAQRGLTSLAAHVIQPDGPGARAVVGFAHSGPNPSAAQLPAGHHAIPQVPAVITHCPPASSVPHLQPPGTPVGPISQTNPEQACW